MEIGARDEVVGEMPFEDGLEPHSFDPVALEDAI